MLTALEDIIAALWEQLLGRGHGPMTFRIALQPLVAVAFAIRSGLRDAREGRPAFLQAILLDPRERAPLVRHGLRDAGRLFVVVAALDLVYQLCVLGGVYPVETLIVVTILAIVLYVVVRGLINRIARWAHRRASPPRI